MLYDKLSIGECEFFYRFENVNGDKAFNQVREQYEAYLEANSNSLSYLKGLISEYTSVNLTNKDIDNLIEDSKFITEALEALKGNKTKDDKETNNIKRRIAKMCVSPLNVNADFLRYYSLSRNK